MKIRFITKYLLAATLFTGVVACQNPLKDFDLQLSTEVIKHKTVLRILDGNGNPISEAEVKLVSGDIQAIYNMEGTKDFEVNGGVAVFGLDPNVTVDDNTTIRFRVEITAPEYITQVVPLTITNKNTGVTLVTLAKPTQAPEDGAFQETQEIVELTVDGSTLAATTVEVPAVNPDEPQLTINIPAGTQFKDANGNVITGGHVTVNVGAFDSDNSNSVALLPGGSLISDAIVAPDGNVGGGALIPAAITEINMVVNGVAVKQLSKPLEISLPIDANYINPVTGQPIKAGDVIDIYSNSSSDNIWKYEKTITVTGSVATGFHGIFTIDHLTWFLGGKFVKSCNTPVVINIAASWIDAGQTYPLIVEAVSSGKKVYSRQYSISSISKTISISDLPSEGVTLYIKKANGDVIATSVLAGCSTITNVVLPNQNPETAFTSTLQLYVRCPNSTGIITLLPTFELFYRESSSLGQFQYLGTVINGLLQTSLLKTDGTKYDFQAHYNNRMKEVHNKTISANNVGTVGNQPGDLLIKDVNNNLGIMQEECNKL